jgi:hypothetical protein
MFGLPEDEYFGRANLTYPESWRQGEIAGKNAENMDSVCIDCHGDATQYNPDALVDRTYLFGANGPLDSQRVTGWELLLKGLP